MSNNTDEARLKLLTGWISDKDYLKILNEKEVYCNRCLKSFACYKKSSIIRHCKSKTHIDGTNPQIADDFNEVLCVALLASDIPLTRIHNSALKDFFQKYSNKDIPDLTTLQKSVIPKIFVKTIAKIKFNIDNDYIWVGINETIDAKSRCLVNVVVGSLRPSVPYKPYLIAARINNHVNDIKAVANIVEDSLNLIFSKENVKYEKVLLLATNNTNDRLIEVGNTLKISYPNMIHITCLANALYNICEFINHKFEDINRFIYSFRNMVLYEDLEIYDIYEKMCSSLSLPPEPIEDQWVTWLNVCLFYAENLHCIKNFILALKDDDSVVECKSIIEQPHVLDQLEFVKKHFKDLSMAITSLEKQNVPSKENLHKFDSLMARLKAIPGEFGQQLAMEVEKLCSENPDLSILRQISCGVFENQELDSKFKPLLSYFKFAPTIGCDVEKTFPAYKEYTEEGTNWVDENLEELMIVDANNSLDKSNCE